MKSDGRRCGDACCGEPAFPISVPSETRTLVKTLWRMFRRRIDQRSLIFGFSHACIVVLLESFASDGFRCLGMVPIYFQCEKGRLESNIKREYLLRMWLNCSSNGLRRRHVPASIEIIGAVVLALCLIGDSPGDFCVLKTLQWITITH
ncbi:hypothetical protein P167DRAFT_325576 [Morchella conica CCBAS932]|uniref:Uncharacterized protein n=1 Tax=Morchella conica CCBAS932 TaxID=1392247 RepID=A0A3N4KF24_9PEZI|nr:hypothetical protein P167DRAFT_325576 [Morchella conica CCBAS932]